nr:WD repeat-containing protein PCN-like isoform X1 [Tanacetum cinerariifolium]
MDGYNRLVHDELSYNTDELKLEHKRLYITLTNEQKGIYETIMDYVDKNKGGMFFVYGYGETGKTYLYKTMSAACRSKGGIVLNVASSGIAALLLEGGRTTHSLYQLMLSRIRCVTFPQIANVKFPDDMLISYFDDHISSIIYETYLDLLQNIYDPDYFQERAILAPTHKLVDMINDRMLTLIHVDEKTYNSSDTVGVADVETNFNETMYTEEFLNNLNMAGIPHHSIKLKIAKIISGDSVGTICAIPRMTLSEVGLFLQRPVFSHGHLYVIVLRVKTKKGLKVLCCDKDGHYVPKETFGWSSRDTQVLPLPRRRLYMPVSSVEVEADSLELYEEPITETISIAIACDDSHVRIYSISDPDGFTYYKSLPRVSGCVLSVTWSPDWKMIYSSSSDGFIRCWDPISCHEVYRITVGLYFYEAHSYHKGDISALAPSPSDTRAFFTGCYGQAGNAVSSAGNETSSNAAKKWSTLAMFACGIIHPDCFFIHVKLDNRFIALLST